MKLLSALLVVLCAGVCAGQQPIHNEEEESAALKAGASPPEELALPASPAFVWLAVQLGQSRLSLCDELPCVDAIEHRTRWSPDYQPDCQTFDEL